MKYFKQGIVSSLDTVGANNESNKRQLLRIKIMLVNSMISQIDIGRLNFEEGMTVVPAHYLLPIIVDLLTSMCA